MRASESVEWPDDRVEILCPRKRVRPMAGSALLAESVLVLDGIELGRI